MARTLAADFKALIEALVWGAMRAADTRASTYF
jgi:hypothetical protein